MQASDFTVVTQPAGHNPLGLPVQPDGVPNLRPSSNFPDDAFDKHGRRIERKTVGSIRVRVKAKTPQGRYGEWAFEICPSQSVREVKDRIALMVSHRLWGGAYRVSFLV